MFVPWLLSMVTKNSTFHVSVKKMSEITELITQEHNESTEYQVDQSVICTNKYLKLLIPETVEDADWGNKEYDNRAVPYIFRPYTEETSVEHRVDTFKNDSSSELFIPESKSNIGFMFGKDRTSMDPYDEEAAEERYLKERPVSFFIISKPNIGEIELAKILANHWKCVLITPESVIKEEIASETRIGKCINFNLVNGRAIGPEVILRLAERRIKSETAKHRGFIVAGFPLIPNALYKEDALSSESAIFNVEEIFEEIVVKCPLDRPITASTIKGSKVSIDTDRVASDEEGEAEQDVEVEIPTKKVDVDLGPDRGMIIKDTDSYYCLHKVTHQLDFLFKLCKKPFVMIYVYCSNMDVVNKIEKYRFNVFTEQEIYLQKEAGDTAFSPNLSSNIPEDDGDNIDLKYLVQLPTYLNSSISAQLISFKYKLLPIIDRNVLAHDPQHFIKVDGRHNALKMFGALRPRIKSLGFQPVLIPERLADSEEVEDEYNEEPQDMPEEISHEETFLKYRYTNVVSPMYKWQLSNWGFKCPVALKNGKIVNGLSENAVRFMNKVFFLSDENALIHFCRNPRPYIIPIKPKPVYRIFVIGPKYSGKSAVAKCLAYLFDCILLNPNELEQDYRRKKELAYLDKVRTAAIAESMVALEELREKDKDAKIKFWLKNTIGLLKTEFPEFKSKTKLDIVESDSTTDEKENSDDHSSNSVVSILSERTHSEIILELEKTNLPLSDLVKVQSFFEDYNNLLEYLPEDLNAPIIPPTVFDPYVTEFVNNAIEEAKLEDTILLPEEIYDMYRTAIKHIENIGWAYNSGWIVDGFPADVNVLKEFPVEDLADEIICLEDDTEYAFLLEKFEKKEPEFTSYKKFFKHIRKHSAAERVPIFMTSSYSLVSKMNRTYSAESYNEEVLDQENEIKEDYLTLLQNFTESWAPAKSYLNSVCPEPLIIVSVINKNYFSLLSECILRIENKYRRTAKIVTDEDKAQEARDFGGKFGGEEEEEEVGEEESPSDDMFLENRRYGDSREYCPVAYNKHFVLWKGKEKLSAEFKEKLYFLSSEDALRSFVEDPWAYLTDNSIEAIPPPRICVVGPIGSGKTTLAKALAQNFGLFYLNFEEFILDALDLDVTHKIDELIFQKNTKDMSDNAQVHLDDVQMLRKYLQDDGQLPDTLLQILSPFWHESPYRSVGFVMDNFPRRTSDITYLTKHYLIPDIVIELHSNLEQIHSRIFHIKMEAWETVMNKRKEVKNEENALKLSIWEVERNKRMTELLDSIKEERREEFFRIQPPIPPYSSPVDSSTALAHIPEESEEEELHMFVYDPVQEQEDLEDIRVKLDDEIPRPDTSDVWETYEEATDRIETMINDTYQRDINLLNEIRLHLKSENIDCVPFATKKSAEGVFLQVSKLTDKLKFRNLSLFERVYSITIDVAEKLLEQGYYFLSKFGRTCPVQVYEKDNPVQMFLSSEHKMDIHPMIHRKHIYFICGAIHAEKFKAHPLMYVQNTDYELPLFPLKIAILGPPKSGKSHLAEKFQKELGVKVITRGQAARYVLKHFPFCELAQNMRSVLEKGWSLTYEMTAGAVEAMTMDGKSISQGYVLDGFPDTVDELKHLKELGIVPYICLDLEVHEEKIRECTLNETWKKMMPPLSHEFINLRCKRWAKENAMLKAWLGEEYQNVYTIPKPESKWAIWAAAKHITFHNMYNMLTYYINKDLDTVFHLKSLLITPFEFQEKESTFKTFCPGCLYYNNYLVSGGNPPEKHGLAQYRDYYYWICRDHFNEFTRKPKRFLPPQNERSLPDDLPYMLHEHCDALYQSGICIVTFWDNQPRNIIEYGTSQYSVLYKHMCYLFCSRECMLKFMKEPHTYCEKIVRFRDPKPLELPQLPTLGYLQQYVARLLTRAIINTETNRPVHPCMTVEQSALMNIALYLKIYNPKTKKEYVPVLEGFRKIFDERRQLLKEMISFFNTSENPFLCLEN